MGAVLSQVVFQAPEMSTYEVDSEGYIAFEKKPRYENALWMEHPMHFIPTSRGVLVAALFLRVENPQCTILLSHGTSEDIGTTTPWAAELATELNANVLVYDYSGYGKSTTRTTPTSPTSLAVRPSEQNVYSDVEACYRYLVNVERVRPCDILAMGRSLGSGAAVHLATRHPVGGLIIVCGVSSIVRVARPKLTKTPVFDMFTNVDKVPTIKCPILFLHGRRDEVVSFECGLQMYAAAMDAHPHRTPPPLWVDDATHNTLETFNREEIFETYRSFVDNWMRNASLQERIKAEWKAVGVDMTSTEWLSEIPAVDNGASGMEQTVAPQTVLDVLGEPQRDLDEKGLQKMVMHSYSRKAIPTELETAPDGTACVPGDFGSRLTTMSSAAVKTENLEALGFQNVSVFRTRQEPAQQAGTKIHLVFAQYPVAVVGVPRFGDSAKDLTCFQRSIQGLVLTETNKDWVVVQGLRRSPLTEMTTQKNELCREQRTACPSSTPRAGVGGERAHRAPSQKLQLVQTSSQAVHVAHPLSRTSEQKTRVTFILDNVHKVSDSAPI
eukprot:CAMPEP_0185843912 /NCGR_PEP_ID=MMETSP1354-20130828/272_1 /TAXON_ID=708628 /ORGANISM="Erythrolobus madagascarensis, Strain CCMP3276" /LENGTH=552 /DNA_ID=CAMNT_0028543501 /DNA_START=168 /DNA_END=1827 /DNA_ORIENTATION=+